MRLTGFNIAVLEEYANPNYQLEVHLVIIIFFYIIFRYIAPEIILN